MSTRVETRRSSKKIEPVLGVNESSYGTRSAGRSHRMQTPVANTPTPAVTRKRQRDVSARRESVTEHAESMAAHKSRRIKLSEEQPEQEPTRTATNHTRKDDETASETIGGAPTESKQQKKQKKTSPALARMQVLQDRFERMVQALVKSQTAYTEAIMAEIRKGTCKELKEAYKPLEFERDERVRIAKKKLQLRKDEADRLWHAARTGAQYDFTKGRADLQYKLRHELSRQMFDVSHEYRALNADSIGMTSVHSKQLKASPAIMDVPFGPQPASLTEKDEDFLLMDIPARPNLESDRVAIEVAPVLDAMNHAREPKAPAQASQAAPTKRRIQAKPQESRQIESAKKERSKIFMPRDSGFAEINPALSITSLLSSSHQVPLPDHRKLLPAPSAAVQAETRHAGAPRDGPRDVPPHAPASNGYYNTSRNGHSRLSDPMQEPPFNGPQHRIEPRNAPPLGEYAPWPPQQQQQQSQQQHRNDHGPVNYNYGPTTNSYSHPPDHHADRHRYGYNPGPSSLDRPQYGSYGGDQQQQHQASYKPYTNSQHQALMTNPHEPHMAQHPMPNNNHHQYRPVLADNPPPPPSHMLPPLPRAQGPPASLLHPFRRSEVPPGVPYSAQPGKGHQNNTASSPFAQAQGQGHRSRHGSSR